MLRTLRTGGRPGWARREWIELLVRLARKAVDLGELPPDVDPVQLSFELNAVLVAANTAFILHGDAAAFERARAAVRNRLGPGGDVS